MNKIHEIIYDTPKTIFLKILKSEFKTLTENLLDSVIVTDKLWHILTLLKLMGCILVSEDKYTKNQQTVFYFKLCSWSTVKSVVMQLVFVLLCYVNTTNS